MPSAMSSYPICTVTSQRMAGTCFSRRDALLEFLPTTLRGVVTTHHGHMSEIEITGPSTAKGVWSMEDHLLWPPGAPMQRLWGTGWYEEEYRREDGVWRIAKMKLRRLRVEIDGELVFPKAAEHAAK